MHAQKRVRERELEVNSRLQVWSKFVNPSKATRFSCSWQQAFGSNGAPLSRTILLDMSQKHFIFFSTPWSLLHVPSLQLSFHFNASSSIFTHNHTKSFSNGYACVSLLIFLTWQYPVGGAFWWRRWTPCRGLLSPPTLALSTVLTVSGNMRHLFSVQLRFLFQTAPTLLPSIFFELKI